MAYERMQPPVSSPSSAGVSPRTGSTPTTSEGTGRISEEETIRVLIADDDPVVRTLLQGMISGEPGLELVATAEDTHQAVELAERHQPDVAVLDWMMPGGGGTTAAIQIGNRSPSTKVVALTVSDSQEASYDMMRAGASAFVQKGGSKEDLVEAIQSAMRYG
jgi:DNA-binding NarL/FixJ family response regulator